MSEPFSDLILATRNVTRRFGSVCALSDVNLEFAGEVHGIIGENGAGKSTLMRILSGVDQPDSGELLYRGKSIRIKSPASAERLGISMIHQELNLVDDLSVADNLFLGREKTFAGFINRQRTNRLAGELLAKVGCEVRTTAKVAGLSIAQKQMVEIAKAISRSAAVLIMDEPTAVLSRREVGALFQLVARLKRMGTAIVFISHILPEILQICDRVTVMRDGAIVETLLREQAQAAGEQGLASKMVGRPMADHFPKKSSHPNDIAVEVRGLSVPGKVNNISFEVRSGEILGFAGLIGAGRTEMAEAICGLRSPSSGKVYANGKLTKIRSLKAAIANGFAYVSEDRKGTGLTIGMSIVANTVMVSLSRYVRLFISRHKEETAAKRHVRDLQIRVGNIRDDVGSLSGGNQQKVALAKWLETEPKVLIIDEPTRGVDVGAKEQIYRLIKALTDTGMACILISSELNEVIGLSHRIAVMRGGNIVTIIDGTTATEEQIMQYAAGVELKASA